MMPTLALPGERMPGAVGTDEARAGVVALEDVVDAQLVVRGDALGDRDDQLDAGGGRLEDRVGGEARRHEDHRRVRLHLGDGVGPAVEHGDALDVLSALAGGDAADDAGAVVAVVERVEGALAAGDPGDAQARRLVDEDRHQAMAPTPLRPAARATTSSAASFIVVAACTLGSPASVSRRRPSTSLVPSRRTTNGTAGLISPKAAISPSATTSQRVIPAKMLNEHGLDLVVGEDQVDGLLDRLGVGAAAGVEEVGGRAAGLRDDVERRHHEPGAVAEDADVAVELDELHALFLGAAFERVFVLLVGEPLVLGVAVERVAVERDLRVKRLDFTLRRDDQRVDLGQRGVLLQPDLVQRDERVGDTVDHVRVGAAVAGDLRGLLVGEPLQRVDVMADQLLGRLLGDLFDVDAALGAEHHERLLGRAVEQHRGVVLGGDVRGVLDPQRADDVSLDVHAEDVAGVLARLGFVGCELHAAGLAAAADQHLRLDDDRVADLVGSHDSVVD